MPCIFNDGLNEGFFRSEVFLQQEDDLVHAIPLVSHIGRHLLHRWNIPLIHGLCGSNAPLLIFVGIRFCACSTFPDDFLSTLPANHCEFIPYRLALLQDNLHSLWFVSEVWIRVVNRETHMLDLTACVFFIGCRIWIAEWDYCITQLTLLARGLHMLQIYDWGVNIFSTVWQRVWEGARERNG